MSRFSYLSDVPFLSLPEFSTCLTFLNLQVTLFAQVSPLVRLVPVGKFSTSHILQTCETYFLESPSYPICQGFPACPSFPTCPTCPTCPLCPIFQLFKLVSCISKLPHLSMFPYLSDLPYLSNLPFLSYVPYLSDLPNFFTCLTFLESLK